MLTPENTALPTVAEVKQLISARGGVEEVTYAALVTKRNASELIPGKLYRITDYKCTTTQPETSAANNVFDIILLATTVDALAENGWCAKHEDDTYFENNDLDAWQVWYCLDNDVTRFAWADATNGKGVIYRLIDEFGNDCPYDFKNILFNRYPVPQEIYDYLDDKTNGGYSEKFLPCYGASKSFLEEMSDQNVIFPIETPMAMYTFTAYILSDMSDYSSGPEENRIYDASLNNYGTLPDNSGETLYTRVDGRCLNNVMEIATLFSEIDGEEQFVQYLNNIVLYGYSLGDGDNDYINCPSNNYFGLNCLNVTAGAKFIYNRFEGSCSSNTFGSDCSSNTFESYCYSNTFGSYCSSNTFGSYCYSNTFESYCRSNTFGNDCFSNTFGSDCDSNTFGSYCYSNTFGSYCYSNTFESYCRSNTFESSCYANTFESSCSSNTFGSYCSSNTFGSGCSSNTFGSDCDSNTFGSDCSSNTFESSCSSNTFGSYCSSNTFGSDCYSNTFGNDCFSNTFGNDCFSNTFGNYCDSNTFGSSCYSNTFGSDCSSNTFGTSKTSPSSYMCFCELEDGIRSLTIQKTINTNAMKVLNICFKRGLTTALSGTTNSISNTARIIVIPDELQNALYAIEVFKDRDGNIVFESK